MGRGAEAAAIAQSVAPRWFGADHNEAVELWNEVPASARPAGDAPAEDLPKDTKEVEGTVKSVVCGEPQNAKNQNGGIVVVLDHAGETLTFREKQGFVGGFADTLWYGADHFTYCHNLEGLRGVMMYRPPSDSSYSGDIAAFEVRNDLATAQASASPAATPSSAPAPVAAPSTTSSPGH
jgi:hypothetical protein